MAAVPEVDAWVISIREKLGVEQVESNSKRRSIYKVPMWLKDHVCDGNDKTPYVPEIISFGPYHRGEPWLAEMEKHKWRCLKTMLARVGKDIGPFIKEMRKIEKEVRDCYEKPLGENEIDINTFVEMLVLDGCFMLEFLRVVKFGLGESTTNYPCDDLVFSKKTIIQVIGRDMIKLENQLPIIVLEKLLAIQYEPQPIKNDIPKLIMHALTPIWITNEILNSKELKIMSNAVIADSNNSMLHCLDIFRSSLLYDPSEKQTPRQDEMSNAEEPQQDEMSNAEKPRLCTLHELFKENDSQSVNNELAIDNQIAYDETPDNELAIDDQLADEESANNELAIDETADNEFDVDSPLADDKTTDNELAVHDQLSDVESTNNELAVDDHLVVDQSTDNNLTVNDQLVVDDQSIDNELAVDVQLADDELSNNELAHVESTNIELAVDDQLVADQSTDSNLIVGDQLVVDESTDNNLIVDGQLVVDQSAENEVIYERCDSRSSLGSDQTEETPIEEEPLDAEKRSKIMSCLGDLFNKVKNCGRPPKPSYKKISTKSELMVYCVKDLKQAGVKFKTRTSQPFWNLNFDDRRGLLEIPPIKIDDATKTVLLNLIAYEQCHLRHFMEMRITDYVAFMDNLVNSADDVGHLHQAEIIVHRLGSDAEVADLFNRLVKKACVNCTKGEMSGLYRQLNKYCAHRRHRWYANLRHDYLTNPWVIVSIVAAIMLVLVALLQTAYAIVAYHKPPKQD